MSKRREGCSRNKKCEIRGGVWVWCFACGGEGNLFVGSGLYCKGKGRGLASFGRAKKRKKGWGEKKKATHCCSNARRRKVHPLSAEVSCLERATTEVGQ